MWVTTTDGTRQRNGSFTPPYKKDELAPKHPAAILTQASRSIKSTAPSLIRMRSTIVPEQTFNESSSRKIYAATRHTIRHIREKYDLRMIAPAATNRYNS